MRRNQPAMMLGVLSILSFFAQLLAQTPLKPSFQVVSVKPNTHSGFSPTTLAMKGNENRFQFKFHRERRELPVYELLVAQNGPKIKLSGNGLTRRVGRGEIEVQGYPFAYFAYLLARQLDRALIDKTNLTKPYNIKLEWNAELRAEAEPSDRPSLFSAVEQLGLKLESAKGPVEVLVIDSVLKPLKN